MENINQPSPLLLPGFKVCLRYHGAVVTSQHYHLLSKEINEKTLEDFIIKKTKWSQREFDMVDWKARRRAYTRLTEFQQLSVTKLIHNLANTN